MALKTLTCQNGSVDINTLACQNGSVDITLACQNGSVDINTLHRSQPSQISRGSPAKGVYIPLSRQEPYSSRFLLRMRSRWSHRELAACDVCVTRACALSTRVWDSDVFFRLQNGKTPGRITGGPSWTSKET